MNNAMTPGMVKTYLREHGYSPLAGRVAALIEAVGGCEAFLTATKGQLEKAYNESHPMSPGATKPYGLGKETLKVVDVARNFIRGVDDASRLDRRIAKERQESENAVRVECYDSAMESLRSEPVDLKILSTTVAWLQQIESEDTLGGVLDAYGKLKRGDAK